MVAKGCLEASSFGHTSQGGAGGLPVLVVGAWERRSLRGVRNPLAAGAPAGGGLGFLPVLLVAAPQGITEGSTEPSDCGFTG